MANYILKNRADQDLQEIWEYTNNKWGEKQARIYLEQLEARFVLLANNPQLGILRDDIFEDYYSFVEQKHVIFYRRRDEVVEIIRILHQSRNNEKLIF